MDYELSAVNAAPGVQVCTVLAKGMRTSRISFSFAWNLGEADSERALLSELIKNSCAKYTDMTLISRRLARLYGASLGTSVSKSGEQQIVKLSLSFIGDKFALSGESIAADCFELLLDLIFDPYLGEDGMFTAGDVEREKRLLAEEIENETNDKAVFARQRLEQLMFADELYSHNKLGTVQRVRELTPADAVQAYKSLLEEAVIRVVLVGDMEFEPLVKQLEERFEHIKRVPQTLKTVFKAVAAEPRFVAEEEDVKQGKLVFGFRAGMNNADDDYPAVRVMTDMFGGNVHSKLFMNVREKMSLCYYCSARLVGQKGFILVQSGIETENEEKAKDAILTQLSDLAQGNFSDEDLKASLDSLTDRFNSVNDTPEEIDEWYASQITTGTLDSTSDYIKRFSAVTREDVIRAAGRVTLDTVYMLRSSGEEA